MSINNTNQLRGVLLESIESIKNGTLEPKKAVAISNLSNRVIQTIKLDLEVIKFQEKQENKNGKTQEISSVPLITQQDSSKKE